MQVLDCVGHVKRRHYVERGCGLAGAAQAHRRGKCRLRRGRKRALHRRGQLLGPGLRCQQRRLILALALGLRGLLAVVIERNRGRCGGGGDGS